VRVADKEKQKIPVVAALGEDVKHFMNDGRCMEIAMELDR